MKKPKIVNDEELNELTASPSFVKHDSDDGLGICSGCHYPIYTNSVCSICKTKTVHLLIGYDISTGRMIYAS